MKISTYTADKLASERTSIPSLDQSGVVLAQAVGNLGEKVFALAERQKELKNQAELVKLNAEFAADYSTGAARIRQENNSNPDGAVPALADFHSQLLDSYKGRIKDPDVALRFDASATEYGFREKAATQIWALKENDKLIQKNLVDGLGASVEQAANAGNIQDVVGLAMQLKLKQKAYTDSWGMAEGSKVVSDGQESMLTAYFVNQISNGNAFQVLKDLQDPRLRQEVEYRWADGKTEKAMLLSPAKLQEVEKQAKAAALKGRDDSASLVLMNFVQEGFDVDAERAKSIAQTKEEINALTFQIGKTKELVAGGSASPDELRFLEQQQALREAALSFKLSQSEERITPDLEVEGRMQAQFQGLFEQKGKKKGSFRATLEQLFDFRKSLEENRASISPEIYEKLVRSTARAFEADINEFARKSKFAVQKEWFGDKLKVKDPAVLSSSKKLRQTMERFVSDYKGDQTRLWDSLMLFTDELDERGMLKDPSALAMISPKDLDAMMSSASKKAALKAAGLPYYMDVDDVITRNGRRYIISGFSDGRIEVMEAP
jgi:hypothetical protein